MTQVVYDKRLPVFDIQVSAERLIEEGAGIFRMEVPQGDPVTLGSKIAVIDPDAIRLEVEVIPNPTMFPATAQHPGCRVIFLKPVAAHADYDPVAIRGRVVDGKWEPLE